MNKIKLVLQNATIDLLAFFLKKEHFKLPKGEIRCQPPLAEGEELEIS
jgi:hypothetical protein